MGLSYFGGRFYDPKAAVWINQDVYRGESTKPMSLHRYQYVYSSPINYFDLYGFEGDGFVDQLFSPFSQTKEIVANKCVNEGTLAYYKEYFGLDGGCTGIPETNAQRDRRIAQEMYADTAKTNRMAYDALSNPDLDCDQIMRFQDLIGNLEKDLKNLEQQYYLAIQKQLTNQLYIQRAAIGWNFVPVLGAGYNFANAGTGTNMFTGEKLSTTERVAQGTLGVVNVVVSSFAIASIPGSGATYSKVLPNGTKLFGYKVGIAAFDLHLHYGAGFAVLKIATPWFVRHLGF